MQGGGNGDFPRPFFFARLIEDLRDCRLLAKEGVALIEPAK
jgi:hypothetical protein